MAHGSPLPRTLIDKISVALGHMTAWLTLIMVITSFAIVVIRYLFDSGFIWLQESLTWMHAMVFMAGAAYTLQQDDHVRVDIFYREMSDEKRAWVDLLGVLTFILPLCVFFVLEAADYVASSWSLKEVSRNSGGLPYPLIPLLKSLLVVMPVTVALQGLSLAYRALTVLRAEVTVEN